MLRRVAQDTYDRLLALLVDHGAATGSSSIRPRGAPSHPPGEAAKCLVLRIKVARKVTRYVLAVVLGDRRLNLDAVRAFLGGRNAAFADSETAERLAGSVAGTVLPLAPQSDQELIVDPDVLAVLPLHFNAARLDRSIVLASGDYERIVRPQVAQIAAPAG